MEQMSVVNAIQCLIKRCRCSARKSAPLQSTVVEEKFAETRTDVIVTQKHLDECDGKSDSTECGDIASDSSDCFEQAPRSAYGASDTTEPGDCANSGATCSEQTSVADLDSPSLRCAPTFRPPPGLELFAEENDSTENFEVAAPPGLGTRLNAEALPFVPNFPMTVPMSSTWEPSMTTLPISSTWEDQGAAVLNYLACAPEETTATDPVAEKPFSYVEQAVEQMTQDEVAKLRALLDTRENVKHSISLVDMIVEEKPQCATKKHNTNVSSRPAPQQSKSSTQGAGHVVKPNETQQQARPPTTLDLEGPTETTLRSNLEELSRMDPARVLMLRKINKLGLRSPAMLNDYFSKFGTVDRVMISHSRAKSIYNPSQTRVRIAGLAFVVMSTAEETRAVLDFGGDHVVQGVGVCVSEFAGNASMENADGAKVLPVDDHDFNTLD